jgi:hypothetical protein
MILGPSTTLTLLSFFPGMVLMCAPIQIQSMITWGIYLLIGKDIVSGYPW